MDKINLRQPYSLKEREHDIWLDADQKTLILKKENNEVGRVNLTEEKIALTVSNQDLFFEVPLKDEDLSHSIKTELNAEIEIGVEIFTASPSGSRHFALLCGLGVDDMRSGRMLQAYNLDLHTVNLFIRDGFLVIEL